MGVGLECVMVQDTAPGAAVTAAAAQSPGSLTVRSAQPESDIRLLSMWGYQNAAGIARLHSPRLHDNVEGIREQVLATAATPLIPPMAIQKLYSQDVMVWENTGSAVAGQIELGFFLAYYQNIGGINARFIDANELARRGVNISGVEVDTTPGVAGGWSGAQPINHTKDNFKANVDYAWIGATFSAAAGAIALSGPDTGNLYVGMPAQTPEVLLLQEWWLRLTRLTGIPLIPVINAANKAGTQVYVAQNQTGTALNITLNLVELAPAGATSPTARPGGM